jgi:hypothetical protein
MSTTRGIALLVLMQCWLTSCSRTKLSSETVEDLRDRLLAASRDGDSGFPDGTSTVLTHFSYVGRVASSKGTIYVVDQRAVIAGMAAPRGLNHVAFISNDFSFLGKLRYVGSRPLWCRGSKVFLWGDLDAGQSSGNVIDLRDGFPELKVVREAAYGSSS